MRTDKRMRMKEWSSDCAVRNVIKQQRRNFWKVLFFPAALGDIGATFVFCCVFLLPPLTSAIWTQIS